MQGNGDYISREAAFEECDWYANEFSECEYAIMPLKGALEILPAADVRPVVRGKWKKRIKAIQADDMRRVVHAHWIFDDFDEDGKDYQCSHCKSYSRNNSDFCPNCGADMRGESDG